MSRGKEIPIILVCALVFSLFTVYVQATKLGMKKIEAMQLERHLAVLEGNAPDPCQYRLFSEYVAEGFLWIAKSLSLPRHIGVAFVAFRLVQNVLIFALVYLYYRELGLNLYAVLTGLTLLAYGMTYSLYDSDLQFNTYGVLKQRIAAKPLQVDLSGRFKWVDRRQQEQCEKGL